MDKEELTKFIDQIRLCEMILKDEKIQAAIKVAKDEE